MDIPTTLYHASPAANLASIMQQGLQPYFPAVYMTDDIKAAKWFARDDGIIFQVDTSDLDPELFGTYHELLCDMLHTTDFWHYYGAVPPSALTPLKEENQ